MPDAESWPLDQALFDQTAQAREVVTIVEGDTLDAVAAYIPASGQTYFVRDGHLIEATLVPWLPDQDWHEAVEAFEPPALTGRR